MLSTTGRRALSVSLVAASLGTAGLLAAQDRTDRPAQATQRPGTVTQLSQAEQILTRARELRETLISRIDAANGRSDIVMVDCLTPLLTQIEGNLVSAEQRLRSLRLVSESGDQAAISHEGTMLSVLGQRFQLIESDMNQCLGDTDITAGDDTVTVEVTVTLPDEDVSAPIPAPPAPPVPFIPPPLSPVF